MLQYVKVSSLKRVKEQTGWEPEIVDGKFYIAGVGEFQVVPDNQPIQADTGDPVYHVCSTTRYPGTCHENDCSFCGTKCYGQDPLAGLPVCSDCYLKEIVKE